MQPGSEASLHSCPGSTSTPAFSGAGCLLSHLILQPRARLGRSRGLFHDADQRFSHLVCLAVTSGPRILRIRRSAWHKLIS